MHGAGGCTAHGYHSRGALVPLYRQRKVVPEIERSSGRLIDRSPEERAGNYCGLDFFMSCVTDILSYCVTDCDGLLLYLVYLGGIRTVCLYNRHGSYSMQCVAANISAAQG